LANIQHANLTGAELHEPKGADSASAGMVYIADGAGSGSWSYLPAGWGYYQHSTTGQSITSTASKLEINGAGSLSTSTFLPREIRGADELWDTTNYKILPIRVGDLYEARIDVPVTAEGGTPTQLKIEFDIGGAATPSTVIFERYFTTGKTTPYTVSFDTSFAALNSTSVTNGIQLFVSTDSGTLTLGAPGITVKKIYDGDY